MDTPHQLSREALNDFKTIYLEQFGELLSAAETQEIALRLLRFLETIQPQTSTNTD